MKSLIGLKKNMKYSIVLTNQAEAQLESIADYIKYKLHEPSTALGIVRGIRKEMSKLSSNPARHELHDNPFLASMGFRRQYYKNYVIHYIIAEETHTVEVAAILHMRVDSDSVLYRMI